MDNCSGWRYPSSHRRRTNDKLILLPLHRGRLHNVSNGGPYTLTTNHVTVIGADFFPDFFPDFLFERELLLPLAAAVPSLSLSS